MTSGTYGEAGSEYRTEIEEFAKVVAWGSTGSGPEWFKVYAKSGLIYEFGNTADSKIANATGSILSWRVNKITDRDNNSVIITYYNSTSDDEQPVKRITYNPNSSTGSPLTRILFYYKYRADISRYCYGGTEFTRDVLLDRIEIENNGLLFKKYEMNYMRDVYSQLQKVTQYSSQGSALNPAAVAWTAQTSQFTQTTNYTGETWELYYVGDYDGDGRDDLVVAPNKESYTSSDKWKLYLADANGMMVWHAEGNLNSYFESFLIGDFNGDGLTDLMMQEKHPDSTYPNKKHYYFYQSDGNTFTRSTSYYLCYNNERLDVVDYNGDGVLEFMFHNTANNWYLYTYSGTSIYSASIPSFGDYYHVDTGLHNRILDFNGDGCSDLLVLFSDGYKIYEFKGNNNILVETYSGTNINNSRVLLFGDYNGDGTVDIIRYSGYYPNIWDLLFLTSDGFHSYDLDCFDGLDVSNMAYNRVFAREMNGDGRTDVVLVGRGDDNYNDYNRINVGISSGYDFDVTEQR
ncbi:MAG: VCBS repeat-containing protein, partial [Mangrovibacterium sp.]|nr:VCBS repeat-containing protein [Mangrovibacterium sp.]